MRLWIRNRPKLEKIHEKVNHDKLNESAYYHPTCNICWALLKSQASWPYCNQAMVYIGPENLHYAVWINPFKSDDGVCKEQRINNGALRNSTILRNEWYRCASQRYQLSIHLVRLLSHRWLWQISVKIWWKVFMFTKLKDAEKSRNDNRNSRSRFLFV